MENGGDRSSHMQGWNCAAAQTRQPKEAYGCQCGAAVLVTGGGGRGPVRPGGAARDRRRAGPLATAGRGRRAAAEAVAAAEAGKHSPENIHSCCNTVWRYGRSACWVANSVTATNLELDLEA